MKRFIHKQFLAFITISLINIGLVSAQENCKVMLEAISGQYEGECKKGLADGFGTAKGTDTYVGDFKKGFPDGKGKYSWANGNVYDGDFKKGFKQGKGVLTVAGQPKPQTGYWDKDEYIGEYESPYKVTYKSPEILSIRISETQNPANDGPALFIEIQHKGKTMASPQFSLAETAGSYTSRYPVGVSTKVLVSSFPFGFTIGHASESCEIQIYKSGSWNLQIDYNK